MSRFYCPCLSCLGGSEAGGSGIHGDLLLTPARGILVVVVVMLLVTLIVGPIVRTPKPRVGKWVEFASSASSSSSMMLRAASIIASAAVLCSCRAWSWLLSLAMVRLRFLEGRFACECEPLTSLLLLLLLLLSSSCLIQMLLEKVDDLMLLVGTDEIVEEKLMSFSWNRRGKKVPSPHLLNFVRCMLLYWIAVLYQLGMKVFFRPNSCPATCCCKNKASKFCTSTFYSLPILYHVQGC